VDDIEDEVERTDGDVAAVDAAEGWEFEKEKIR